MDVVVQCEVLARLPLRELVRLRCVCKSWRDVISEPWFIKHHQALNPIPTGLILTYSSGAQGPQGTFLFDPRRAASSWVRTPSLNCPNNPSGVLLSASGGLLCFGISRRNEAGQVIEVDFVIWNPVTNRRTQLPTLHVHPESVTYPAQFTDRPIVAMVIRRGELHQLWVCLFHAYAVFDCFISIESMQTRMACNRKIRPLQNSWIALWLRSEDGPFCHLDSKIILKHHGRLLRTVDVDNFTVSDFHLKEGKEWMVMDLVLWKGKVAALVNSTRVSDQSRACVCDVIFDTRDGTFDLDLFLQFVDKSTRYQAAAVTGDYLYTTFYTYKGSKDRLVHLVNKRGGHLDWQGVEHPEDEGKRVATFEPSLSASPGSPCDVNFDGSGFQFPERTETEVEERDFEWIFMWSNLQS